MTVDGASPLRAVVEVIVRALVDKPDSVRVAETERRGMTVLELTARFPMPLRATRMGTVVQSRRPLSTFTQPASIVNLWAAMALMAELLMINEPPLPLVNQSPMSNVDS